jgi:patatin-like phospholipase/acyl hydrolase
MAPPFKILSIDGGGIRGLIPALVLTEIERRSQKPVSSLFDLIAGTSTGGIIALGVTKPGEDGGPAFSAEEIADLYLGRGERIFSAPFLHQLLSGWGLLDEKYPAKEVEAVFEEYFGEARLQDALTEVLVTSFDIEAREPWLFRRTSALEKPETHDFPMQKVARATSAAPTYFEPLKLEAGGGKMYALVDGGVYANNPAMCALVDARRIFGADDVLVVSLGTGEPTQGIPWKDAKDWGLAGWARPLLDIMFEGVSDTVAFQVDQLCPAVDGVNRSYRFQVRLPKLRTAVDDIDDASEATLRALRQVAETMIQEETAKLDEVCSLLTAGP